MDVVQRNISPLTVVARCIRSRAQGFWWAAVAGLLLILAVELFVPAFQQSQTPDEANHLLAGARYWQYGDFGSNPEHPPFAKLIAALPVLGIPCPPPSNAFYFKGENFDSGNVFLYTHDADAMLWHARLAISAFAFVLALLVLAAGCEMFDRTTGLLALLILVFEPTLLAHGAMITTDVAATCCIFGAVFAFYRWQSHPTAQRLIACGIAFGLALAAKHSAIFLVPVFLVLASLELFFRTSPATLNSGKSNSVPRMAGSSVLIALIAYTMLWAFYGFRYQARPGALAMTPTLVQFAASSHKPWVEAVIPKIGSLHLLPEAYLFGIVDIIDSSKRDPMFLLGQDYTTGHWFYFPVAILIKATLGMLALLMLAPFLKVLRQGGKRRVMVYLLVPSLLYLAASLASTMDIGIRHILPVFPFFILIAAATAVALGRKQPWGIYAAASLLLFHVASSAHVFPNYLTYANEAWGGPQNTFRLLTDSNADWGQGLRATKNYLDANGIHDCWFAHYGWNVDPAYYHISCKPLPEGLKHMFGSPLPLVPPSITGTILVSGSEADGDYWGPGDLNPYAQFLHRRPDAIIANSVLVFRGQFAVPELSAFTHMSQAQQFAGKQQWGEALSEAHLAIKLNPGSAEAHALLGNLFLQLHRTDEARQSFQQALSLAHSDHPEFQLPRVLNIPAKYISQ